MFKETRRIAMRAFEAVADRKIPLVSRGNVRLQTGCYMTRKDIDALKKKALSHAF